MAVRSIRLYEEYPVVQLGADNRTTATSTQGVGGLGVPSGLTMEMGHAYAVSTTDGSVSTIPATAISTWAVGVYCGTPQFPEGSSTLVGATGTPSPVGAVLVQGCFDFVNDGTNAITAAHIGTICYFTNTYTVCNATGAGTTTPKAGKVVGLNADGTVKVAMHSISQ